MIKMEPFWFAVDATIPAPAASTRSRAAPASREELPSSAGTAPARLNISMTTGSMRTVFPVSTTASLAR